MLGPLAQEHWIARLEGPAPPVKQVKVGGIDQDLLAVCKQHDCAEHAMVLLYAPSTGSVAGKVVQAGHAARPALFRREGGTGARLEARVAALSALAAWAPAACRADSRPTA